MTDEQGVLKARDTETGEIVKFRWNGAEPPTESDMAEVFAAHRAKPAAPATAGDPNADMGRTMIGGTLDNLATMGDAAVGAGKRLLEYGQRGGKVLRDYVPGLNALPNLTDSYDTAPTSTAQKVGGAGFDILSAIAPSRAVSALGIKAGAAAANAVRGPSIVQGLARVAPRVGVEAAAGGATAAIQGGDVTTGAVFGGAAPVIGSAVAAVAPRLKAAASEGVVKALGPTKERFKAMAERVAPEVLRRGLRGSREGVQAQAREHVKAAGQQIDNVLTSVGARRVDPTTVVDALESSKDGFRNWRPATVAELTADPKLAQQARATANGAFELPVPHSPQDARAISQIEQLQRTVESYGPDMSAKHLVAMRRAWDTVVDQAGGYAQRGRGAIGVPLKDQAEAAIKRDGASAIRKLLDQEVPELSAINKEFAFWKTLDDVTTQSLKRSAPQGQSLGTQIAQGGGGVVGAILGSAAGGPMEAAAGAAAFGAAAGMAKTVLTSPRWRLASAQMKDRLAEAIMSGNHDAIATALGRIAGGPVNAVAQPREASMTIYSNRPMSATPK
jgi:hypothetical protein